MNYTSENHCKRSEIEELVVEVYTKPWWWLRFCELQILTWMKKSMALVLNREPESLRHGHSNAKGCREAAKDSQP